MKRKNVFLKVVIVAIILGMISLTVYADPSPDASYWQGPAYTESDWFSSGNWNNGIPGSSDDACVDNGGIATISSGNAAAGSLYLAPGTTIYPAPGWNMKEGHLLQSGGSLTITNKLVLSATSGTTSSYKLIDGSVSSQELRLGGNSLFQQSGGTNTTSGLTLAGTSSKYKLESGALTVNGEEKIDNSAVFEQTGGNHTADFLVLGSYPYGDKGNYILKNGTLGVNCSMELSDGSTFQHTGGSAIISTLFNDGNYSLSQDSVPTASILTTDLSIVKNGGSFSQSGGQHHVRQQQHVSGGHYTLSGGTHTIDQTLYIYDQAAYRMTGGSLTANSIEVGGNRYTGATLEVGSGCAVSVKDGFFQNTMRVFEDGLVDLTQGGKVLIGNVDAGLTTTATIGTDGVLEGTGTILGNVSNQGIVRSGLRYIGQQEYSPGILTITGDYQQQFDGTLAIFLAGTDEDSFSRLSILGIADIAGELNISLIGGFVPDIGDSFEILNASACYGNFSLVNTAGLPDGMFFDIDYTNTNIVLEVVPEPATLMLFGLGSLILRKRFS